MSSSSNKLKYQKIFNLLVYLSLIFLIYYLISNDIFEYPKKIDYFMLLLSLLALILFYIVDIWIWHNFLYMNDNNFSFKDSYVGCSVSILSKYIPGKFGLVVGPPFYLSSLEKYEVDVISLSNKTFINQIILIVAFGIVGGLGVFLIGKYHYSIFLFSVSAFLFTIFCLTGFSSKLMSIIDSQRFKDEFISIKTSTITLFFHVFNLILLSASFYLFLISVSPNQGLFLAAFGYPFAVFFGLVALFAPGGLGIREGALILFLVNCSITHN